MVLVDGTSVADSNSPHHRCVTCLRSAASLALQIDSTLHGNEAPDLGNTASFIAKNPKAATSRRTPKGATASALASRRFSPRRRPLIRTPAWPQSLPASASAGLLP